MLAFETPYSGQFIFIYTPPPPPLLQLHYGISFEKILWCGLISFCAEGRKQYAYSLHAMETVIGIATVCH